MSWFGGGNCPGKSSHTQMPTEEPWSHMPFCSVANMAPLLPGSLYSAGLPLAALATQHREAQQTVAYSVAESSVKQRFLMGNAPMVPAASEKKIAMYSKVG